RADARGRRRRRPAVRHQGRRPCRSVQRSGPRPGRPGVRRGRCGVRGPALVHRPAHRVPRPPRLDPRAGAGGRGMTGPHPLDGLIDDMLPTATEIAVCVRDRDTAGVHAALGPVLDAGDRDQVAALIIALAVMVPDDVTFGDLVAWTYQDQLPYGELVIGPG